MSDILTPDDLIVRYPHSTRQTWANKRYEGTGPTYFKVGRRVYYRLEDVLEWEESQLRTRTDEVPQEVA